MSLRLKILWPVIILAIIFVLSIVISQRISLKNIGALSQEVKNSSKIINTVYLDAIYPQLQLIEKMAIDPLLDQEPEALNDILLKLRNFDIVQSFVRLN